MTLKRFCGSPEHAVSRRGFLTSLAAMAGAAAFADMTAHSGARLTGRGRRSAPQSKTGHHALAGRRGQPAGNVRPQARRADRRAVPVDPDLVARRPHQRIDAAHGRAGSRTPASSARSTPATPIMAPPPSIMMRGRMGEPSVDYPDLGAVMAREMGLQEQPGSRLRLVLHGDRRAQHVPRQPRLPRRSLRLHGPDHLDGAREHSPGRRQRSGSPRTGRAAQSAQRHVRTRPDFRGAWKATIRRIAGCRASWPTNGSSTSSRNRSASAIATARRCLAGSAWRRGGCARRACRSSASAGPGGIRMPRTSNRIRSWSPNSITSWRRCSTISKNAACCATRWSSRSRSSAGRRRSTRRVGRDHFASAWSTHPVGLRRARRLGLWPQRCVRQPRRRRGNQRRPAVRDDLSRSGHQPPQELLPGARPIPLTEPGTEPIREVLA